MQLLVDIPNGLYANLGKIQNGSIAAKRILQCVRDGEKAEQEPKPKTGRWIFKSFDPDTGISYTSWCSECNKPFAGIYKSYCPNCGAKMQEVKK